jgi:heat-inducible transcriptional repressor
MQAAVQVSSEAITQAQDEVVISGERNLLAVSDFSQRHEPPAPRVRAVRAKDPAHAPAGRLQPRRRRAHLTSAAKARSCRLKSCPWSAPPTRWMGSIVGTLGVIGPTRMPYDRMIQIVDITSRLVSNALSHNK